MENLFFIAGAQCTGKTSIINELKKRCYYVIPEAAREIALRDGRFFGEGIAANRRAFQDEIFATQKRFFENIPSGGKVIFSDRGFGDTLAYYRAFGLEMPRENFDYARRFCDSRVFILELLGSYQNDGVRKEPREEREKIQNEILKVYEELGNEIVLVPRMSIEERTNFILKNLKISKIGEGNPLN